jgi:hypothetical protein
MGLINYINPKYEFNEWFANVETAIWPSGRGLICHVRMREKNEKRTYINFLLA